MMTTGTGGPRSETTTPAQAVGLLSVSHKQMDSARLRGEVAPLAAGVTWIARYRGSWWIAYERRWLRVTDQLLHADLDRASSRLAAAGSETARLAVLRQSLAIIAPAEAGEQA